MEVQQRCSICNEPAGSEGELWRKVRTVSGEPAKPKCRKCYEKDIQVRRLLTEIEKEVRSDQAFIEQEKYDSEQEYLESQRESEEL